MKKIYLKDLFIIINIITFTNSLYFEFHMPVCVCEIFIIITINFNDGNDSQQKISKPDK